MPDVRRSEGRAVRPPSRKAEVLAEIRRYQAAHGISPTGVELAESLGLCCAMIARYLDQLERDGLVSALYASGKRSPRSLVVVASGDSRGVTVVEISTRDP